MTQTENDVGFGEPLYLAGKVSCAMLAGKQAQL